MVDLSKIGERERLKPRASNEPYWQRLQAGWYLGFRPSKRGGKGMWFARIYDEDAGKYRRKGLGACGTASGNEVFAAAKKQAEAFAELVETGGIQEEKLETVADACRAYLIEKPGSIAEGVFRRHIYDDVIARVKLDKLRRRHLREWRQRLENAPALVSRNKKGPKQVKNRSAATINRDMVPVRAALGRIKSPGTPNTDSAWQEALKPIRGAGKRRDIYLDLDERRSLVRASTKELEPFLIGLCVLPLRPGALASLKVGDFDRRTRTLTVGVDKSGKPRQITVPQNIADLLIAQCLNKLPGAWIFMRQSGARWTKDSWKHPVKEAVLAAGLRPQTSAYTLRHSVITDLVRGGLPILTTSQLADTSVAMIELHYGHLVRSDAEYALAQLAF